MPVLIQANTHSQLASTNLLCAWTPEFANFILFCTGGRAYSNAHFGAGSGPIFLDDVQCTSISEHLLECPSRPILFHNCLHSADASVGCEGMFIAVHA